MPAIDKASILKLIVLLSRFVPIVAKGLGIAFIVVAAATVALDVGNYPTSRDRYLVASLFAFFAVVSFGIGLSVKPILRWILRRF